METFLAQHPFAGFAGRRRLARVAVAAMLLYRLVSFWLAAGAGWLVFLWLRRHRLTEDVHQQASSGIPGPRRSGQPRYR